MGRTPSPAAPTQRGLRPVLPTLKDRAGRPLSKATRPSRPPRATIEAPASTQSGLSSGDSDPRSPSTLWASRADTDRQARDGRSGEDSYFQKLKKAWGILFPPEKKEPTPKESGKERLRMVLVADRCGLSPAALAEMKRSIAAAVSNYVEVADSEGVDFDINVSEDNTVFYSVGVPVKKARPEKRFDSEFPADAQDWSPEDPEGDPSHRFPCGC